MGINTKDPRLSKSKWFKWEDMTASAAQFRIERITLENYAPDGQPEELKITLWLFGASGPIEKGFGMNVTNTITLEDEWGDDTDAWLGKVIELRIEKTQYKDQRVNCLRVHLPQAAPAPQPVPQAPAPARSPDPAPAGEQPYRTGLLETDPDYPTSTRDDPFPSALADGEAFD